ncbi:hypothetical protein ACF07D_04730 [Leucobacter sp. NPDC015123]|uniref:hypothetical protein n=1 Tax=Leucobacter sp. NPDC015123 TaxID=3364129 RepID=UPI0036F48E8D
MTEYTTEEVLHEVLWSKIDEFKPEFRARFYRWLAEVQRAAAEEALTCAANQWRVHWGSNGHETEEWLRRRAEAYRRNEGENDGRE